VPVVPRRSAERLSEIAGDVWREGAKREHLCRCRQ
jgi:hypothetical protein